MYVDTHIAHTLGYDVFVNLLYILIQHPWNLPCQSHLKQILLIAFNPPDNK